MNNDSPIKAVLVVLAVALVCLLNNFTGLVAGLGDLFISLDLCCCQFNLCAI